MRWFVGWFVTNPNGITVELKGRIYKFDKSQTAPCEPPEDCPPIERKRIQATRIVYTVMHRQSQNVLHVVSVVLCCVILFLYILDLYTDAGIYWQPEGYIARVVFFMSLCCAVLTRYAHAFAWT